MSLYRADRSGPASAFRESMYRIGKMTNRNRNRNGNGTERFVRDRLSRCVDASEQEESQSQ
jgi:hypothetical protein